MIEITEHEGLLENLSSFDSQELNEIIGTIDSTPLQIPEIDPDSFFAGNVNEQSAPIPPNVYPPHLDRIPDFVVEKSHYEFDVELNPENNNNNCVYNPFSRKLFIKMSSVININAMYKPQMQIDNEQCLFLRAMIVFTSPNEMHIPVTRCANHRTAGAHSDHILKCCHPSATYHGNEKGCVFRERLAVVVPLTHSVIDESGFINESIGLEFGCQNSCSSGINRKQTSIVFTLEDREMRILGKTAFQFKVCSCPKRDSERESRESVKRKAGGSDTFPKGKIPKYGSPVAGGSESFPNGKVPLYTTANPRQVKTEVKMEVKTEVDDDAQAENVEEPSTTYEPVTITNLMLPDRETAQHVLKVAFDAIAGRRAENPADSAYYLPFMRRTKKMLKDFTETTD